MSDVQELIEAVQASGVTIRIDGSDLKIRPAGILPSELKSRLKEHKAEILRQLELEASMKRLEAASIRIAVWEDGGIRVLGTESDTFGAVKDGGTVYSPQRNP
jgi:hypothetical protein